MVEYTPQNEMLDNTSGNLEDVYLHLQYVASTLLDDTVIYYFWLLPQAAQAIGFREGELIAVSSHHLSIISVIRRLLEACVQACIHVWSKQ